MVTRRPRHLSRRPREDAVKPFPRDDDTPPVKKMNLVDRDPDGGWVAGAGPAVGCPPEGCGGPSMSGT
jgi:hypothetical protein